MAAERERRDVQDVAGDAGSAPDEPRDKLVDLDSLARHLDRVRAAGRTVVHCHGVFDILHVGHVEHLRAARALGDVLVVTVTPDEHVNKGPDRPAFPAQLRARMLAALECVDHVAINRWPTAVETVALLRPDVYVKGSEYARADDDRTGGITREAEAVETAGGRVAFTDEITFSASRILHHHTDHLPAEVREFLTALTAEHDPATVLELIERMAALRVAVVGESIIDEYQYCDAIGKSTKEPTLAVRPYSVERHAGGAVAVANLVAQLAGETILVSALGGARPEEEFVRGALVPGVEARFLTRAHGPTIVKRRFIDRYFFHKLFEVYELDDRPLDAGEAAALAELLDPAVAAADVVLVVDYGHGLIGPGTIDRIASAARFLAVNTQTNAGNLGFHTIGRYPRADFVSLAEHELRLDARDRQRPVAPLARALVQRTGARAAAITRGAQGCLLCDAAGTLAEVPALAREIRDRMGAGDTFLAVAALARALEAPLAVTGFLGNALAAHAVATVGHAPVPKLAFLRQLECLLR